MEVDYFDVGVIGTSLNSPNEYEKGSKTIFLEPSNNYGTTYNSIEGLSSSYYLKKVVVNKRSVKGNTTIEAIPFFFKNTGMLAEKFINKPFSGSMEYVEVFHLYFIDNNKKIVKLFNTKNEIVKSCVLNNTERYYLYDGIKKKDLSEFTEYLEGSGSELLKKIFIKYCIFDSHLLECFNKAAYLYPVHGMSSLCENISLTNSINGATYLLSNKIVICEESGKSEYKYKVCCEYGTIYLKRLVSNKMVEKEWFVKTLVVEECKFTGEFLIYLESDNDVIRIYGIGSRAKVCENNIQMLYIVKEHGYVNEKELEALEIKKSSILLDLDFVTKYDINQFNKNEESL